MGISVAVTLEPDAETKRRISQLWDVLRVIDGVQTTEMLGAQPHLTLGIYEGICVSNILESFRVFAISCRSLSLNFPCVSIFPSTADVLCLSPTPTLELLDLHGRLHMAFADMENRCRATYRENHWIPHLTLARGLTSERLGTALELLREAWTSIDARFEECVLVTFMPVVEVDRVQFAQARV